MALQIISSNHSSPRLIYHSIAFQIPFLIMFLINFVPNCSGNQSSLTFPTRNPNITSNENELFDTSANIFIAIFAMFGFITNTLTVFTLSQPRFKGRSHNMRYTSLYHAIIELVLDLWIFIDKVCSFGKLPEDKYITAMLFSTLCFWSINALLCSRNWMVTLVALARLEAIFSPLKIRSNSIFSPCKSRIYTIIVLISSYSLSVVRVLYKKAVVCQNDNSIHFVNHWRGNFLYNCFEIFAFFIYQSVFPVVIVTLATFTMIFILFNHKFNAGSLLKQYFRGNENNNIMTSQQKATLTITVLAGVFTVTEIPIFIITLLRFTYPDIISNKLQILYQITRALVVIDSCCNFLIYVSTSEHYRRDLWYLCQRHFRWHKRLANDGASLGMTRVVSYIPNSRRNKIC